jgi:hypothetical protein
MTSDSGGAKRWFNKIIGTPAYASIQTLASNFLDWTTRRREIEGQAYHDFCLHLAEIEALGTVPDKGWETLAQELPLSSLFREMLENYKETSYCTRVGQFLLRVSAEDRATCRERYDKSAYKEYADSSDAVQDRLLYLEKTSPSGERPSDLSTVGLRNLRAAIKGGLKEKSKSEADSNETNKSEEPEEESKQIANYIEQVKKALEQQERLMRTFKSLNEVPSENQMRELWNQTITCFHMSDKTFNTHGLRDFNRKYDGGSPTPINTRVRTELPKLIYFPAFVGDGEILERAYRHVILPSNGLLGGMYSFGNYQRKNIRLWNLWGSTATIADCGAIQMPIKPTEMTLNNFEQRLIEFYIENEFDFLIEPDSRHPSFEAKLFHTILRTREFYRCLPQKPRERVVRVIFGKDNRQRQTCYEELAKTTGFTPDYIAIGGINDERSKIFGELEELLTILRNNYQAKKIHLLGLTSEKAMRFANEWRGEFDLVSIDGSTWAQAAFEAKSALVFNPEGTGKLARVSFRGGVLSGSDVAQVLLEECRCPACTQPLLKLDDGKVQSVWTVAHQMLEGNEFAQKVFDLKAHLHNLWHQAQFLTHLVK